MKKFNDDITVKDLESLELIFPSEIVITDIDESGFTKLLSTSNNSLLMSDFYNLNPDPKINPLFNQLNEPGKIIGARVVNVDNDTGKESNITLVSDSQFFSDQGGGSSPNNITFTLNTIDYMLGDSELISLRSREVTDRPLLDEMDGVGNQTRLTWKIVNMLLPSLLIMVLGFIVRKRQTKKSRILAGIYEK